MYKLEEVTENTLKYFGGDELATKVWIDKYCLKDRQGNYYELTPDDMHKRLAKEIARIENNYPNPLSEDEIYNLLKGFKYIVPQGSPMFGIGNDFTITSLSNCFVIGSAIDSYGGIMRTDEEQVQLMKRRGGVGHDLSNLRPSGAMANNSVLKGMAGSTLYMNRYSNSTREVSQGDRRGALMLSMDIKHPDSEQFIDAKMEQGKVTGANISVKISDEFMQSVICGENFYQTFPIHKSVHDLNGKELIKGENEDLELNKLYSKNGGYYKRIDSKKLWDKIIHNAWKSAEPGILFWDKVINESPADCYSDMGYETVSTNPCFTGDTIVAVADGRNGVTIKDLAEYKQKFLVYSAKKKVRTGWKAEIKSAIAFKTGTKQVIQLELSDGSIFKCTPDHKLALPNGEYIEAKDSLGMQLEKFYSFSNKNSSKSYRHINSKTNGYTKQYRMIWEYLYGVYDGKIFNIDHIDSDSTNDSINNLSLLSIEEHKNKTKRLGEDNPIQKIVGTERHRLMNIRKNILANGSKYNWSNDDIQSKLDEFDIKYGDKLNTLKPKNINVNLSEDVFVENIVDCGVEDVYDLTVEDNHNFYIITKTDDEKFLNSSGVLVHNCGEIPLCPYDSCRLLAINLYSYVENPFTKDAYFNFELFIDHVRKAQRIMDDIVDLEIEKLDKIIDKIKSDPEPEEIKKVELDLWLKVKQKAIEGRRTGLGITAEGDMLAALGIIYGTKEAVDFSESLHQVMATESYSSSIIMATERGAFSIWDLYKEQKSPFIQRVLHEIANKQTFEEVAKGTGLYSSYLKYGRRNISNLTIAPTGTTSLMTQTTSGIEPVFMPVYKRRRKVNDKDLATFVDEVGDMWEEYVVFHHKFKIWMDINGYDTNKQYSQEELNKLVSKSPYYKATSNDVDYLGKVRMQGRIQKWIDHSISVTINMPEDVTEQTVSEVYLEAWRSGCKGVTVYREGSRSGVLISNDNKQGEELVYNNAFKRPDILKCDIYNLSRGKQPFTLVVGKVNKKPFEIFALEKIPNTEFCDKISEGTLTKTKSRTYQLDGEIGGKLYRVNNIVQYMTDNEQNDTRKYSLMLRHGIKPKFIVEQISEYATINSFEKVIAKVLSNYLEGEKLKGEDICPNCNSHNLRNESGCITCNECGWSKCG